MRITVYALFAANILASGSASGAGEPLLPDPAVGDTTLGHDNLWREEFVVPGPMGCVGRASEDNVDAIAVYQGKLVVAGNFGYIDGIAAPGMASWDGNAWAPFSKGFPLRTPPDAMVQFGERLVAGGFSSRSTAPLHLWDGVAWTPLPLPATNFEYQFIRKLAVYENNVIACGGWSSLSDSAYASAPLILRWNGITWSDMSANIRGSLRDVLAIGDSLYVAGAFSLAPDTTQVGVACWNGDSWIPVGDGISGPVYSISIHEGRLFVAGHFSRAGNVTVPSIAILNGDQWAALPAGFDGLDGAHVHIHAMASFQGSLMVSGFFDTTGTGISSVFRDLALWNGSTWASLGNELRGMDEAYYSSAHSFMVEAFAVHMGKLVIAGRFWQAGRATSGNLAEWDGTKFAPLVPQPIRLAKPPRCFLATDNGLLAAGTFTLPEGYHSVHGVARWNGTNWQLLGSGMNGDVRALALHNGYVIAAGDFTLADGRVANHLAQWNENGWMGLGQGTDDVVTSLEVFDGRLIAAGLFRHAGDQAADRIASWNGSVWLPLGGGLSGPGVVYVSDLTVYRGELMACGNFTWAGDLPASYIAAWNGVSWRPLAPEVPIRKMGLSRIDEMVVWKDRLIARSYFFIDPTDADREPSLASWDGSKWEFCDHLPNGGVTKLGSYGGRLVIGGWFYSDAGSDQGYAFLYDGMQVLRMGHGIWSGTLGMMEGPSLTALATWQGRLYLGGSFLVAGERPSFRMAAWEGHEFQITARPLGLRATPNPVRSSAMLSWELKDPGRIRLAVIDLQGREVVRLIDDVQAAGPAGFVWNLKDGSGFPVAAGVYFVRLSAGEGTSSKKIIVTH